MNPKPNLPRPSLSVGAQRALCIGIACVILATVLAVIATLIGGASKPAQPPVDLSPTLSDRPSVFDPTPDTDEVIADTDAPTLSPDTQENTEVMAPITWHLPLEAPTLSKSHDLLRQVFSQTMNDYRVHCGVDLQSPMGSDVLAVADGVVENIYTDPFEGTCIRIAHAGGYRSVYKNLAPTLLQGLKEGDAVVGGQVLGSVGESAIIEISDEPHLHLEVYLNGVAVDPMELLPNLPTAPSYAE